MCPMKKLTHVFEQHDSEDGTEISTSTGRWYFCIIYIDNKTESCNRSVYTKTN